MLCLGAAKEPRLEPRKDFPLELPMEIPMEIPMELRLATAMALYLVTVMESRWVIPKVSPLELWTVQRLVLVMAPRLGTPKEIRKELY